MARINSKRKGARCEREAAKYLVSLGFDGARRGQQFRGGADSPDVLCAALPLIHIECKADESIRLGTAALRDALIQSYDESGKDERPVVLWKNNRTGWRLTFCAYGPSVMVTVAGDADIAAALRQLQAEAEVTKRTAYED